MSTHEELAELFQRNFTLQQPPPPAPEPEPIIYSISRHYHHSSHIPTITRPASEPPQTDLLTTEIILSRHGINISSLNTSQLSLFRTADAGQQMRLVELWRICPPENTGYEVIQDLNNSTSFEQEEHLAKLRYERQMTEERMSRFGGDGSMDSDTMSDFSNNGPLTPIQGGDGRWATVSTAEPYMQSGYEALAQREYESSTRPKDVYSHFGTSVGGPQYKSATDPVYNNVGGDWDALMQQRQAAMENQYGAFAEQHYNARQQEDEEML